MNVVELHPEQLFDALRKGRLTAADRARLEAHCARCTACTFELRWLEAPPIAAEPTAEDCAYGEAALDNVLRTRGAQRIELPQTTVTWPLRLSVGVALLAVGAAVTWFVTQPGAVEEPRTLPPVVTHVPELSSQPSEAPRSVQQPELVGSSAKDTPVLSANQLLATARRAHTRGQIARAERLYRQVIEGYPATSAAGVAQLALGRLLYEDRARPSAALAQFDAYLRQQPTGSLAEEALYYRALSLDQLGQSARAAESLRTLLRRYPRSIYAGQARARVDHEPTP